ncbi:unnamed protein product [Cunninghamella echinulata]
MTNVEQLSLSTLSIHDSPPSITLTKEVSQPSTKTRKTRNRQYIPSDDEMIMKKKKKKKKKRSLFR